ncbi:hypothetical protein [Variovorax paradoxus]|uniref:hypothetical protein n=1 Tax=Variovorax paradoxus TaxID=34073 RepID=UPI003D65FD55
MDYIKNVKIIFLIFFLLALGVSRAALATGQILVEAENKSWMLEFKVMNLSNQSLSIFKNSLPWNSPGGAKLFAFCGADKSRPLRENLVPGYDPNFVQLAPLSVLKGKVDLRLRFPEIEGCVKERKPAVIFWFYRPNMEGENPVEDFNGMIFLQ